MYVTKRNGRKEPVHFEKITTRISRLCYRLHACVDPVLVSQKVIQGVFKGVTTSALDALTVQVALELTPIHHDYEKLATRISVSDLHKSTHKSFLAVMRILHTNGQLDNQTFDFLTRDADTSTALDAAIVYDRDLDLPYDVLQQCCQKLQRHSNVIIERPQHMFMRLACTIHTGNVEATIATYNLFSLQHAVWNYEAPSCSMSMFQDSIEGIYDTVKASAQLANQSYRIGLAVQNIRASGSYIRGTNGNSNGLVPMLRVFNESMVYAMDSSNSSRATNSMDPSRAMVIYIEPWHADFMTWLDLKKPGGISEERARNQTYAICVPDLLMKRVETNGEWSFFCPNEATGLADLHGEAFEHLYTTYEALPDKARKTVPARQVWDAIVQLQLEINHPRILFKDASNAKTNRRPCDVIRGSDATSTHMQCTTGNEVATAESASVSLVACVTDAQLSSSSSPSSSVSTFDFQKLYDITYQLTYVLEAATPSTKTKYNTLAIGCHGLIETFFRMRYPYESPEARQLNIDIFETMYFAALTASNELAKQHGCYDAYPESSISQGILQCDMWTTIVATKSPQSPWNWASLRASIAQNGVRHSLLMALDMSYVRETSEPYDSNLYVRQTNTRKVLCVNRHLVDDLLAIDMWTPAVKNQIIDDNGSIQACLNLPSALRARYKTAWEISQKTVIDMACDRNAYICQSQALVIHMPLATAQKITSMHFYAWKKGLKTGMCELKTKPAIDVGAWKVKSDFLAFRKDEDQHMSECLLRKQQGLSIPIHHRHLSEPTMSSFGSGGVAAASTGFNPCPSPVVRHPDAYIPSPSVSPMLQHSDSHNDVVMGAAGAAAPYPAADAATSPASASTASDTSETVSIETFKN